MMTLEEYAAKRARWQAVLPSGDLEDFWFGKIAPVKASEYGIECWERLGPKGLIADVSAMYYRWKSLRDREVGTDDPAMFNALVDAFGYAVMFNICCDNNPHQVFAIQVNRKVSPGRLNEAIIERAWDNDNYSPHTGALVLRQAYAMRENV